jgi:hypothetical protein
MAIATAAQKGAYVHVYNEQGAEICSIPAFEGLVGYTSTTVTVKGHGGYHFIYNDKEQQISQVAAG